jgi:hypothetical protein
VVFVKVVQGDFSSHPRDEDLALGDPGDPGFGKKPLECVLSVQGNSGNAVARPA